MASLTPIRVAAFAMRTRFEIVLWDAARTDADLRAAGEEALREIAETETLLSAYRPDAALYRLNEQTRAAAGTFAVPTRLAFFLRYTQLISRLTQGAFDPTLGDADTVTFDPIRSVSETPFSGHQFVTTSRPGVRFDAGAIGKGYALDRARESLREAGIRNALLHGGTSSVVALGNEPGGDAWRVAIASPRREAPPVAVWHLRDGDAMAVSANHERPGHILDPRTKQPVPHARLAAVLVSGGVVLEQGDAALADAVSTALLVLGEAGIPALRGSFPEVREWLLAGKESPDGNAKEF